MTNNRLESALVSSYFKRFSPEIEVLPVFGLDINLELIVVIPAKNEKDILTTMDSLENCDTDFNFGVLVVINSSKDDPKGVLEQNEKTAVQIKEYKSISKLNIEILEINDIDPRHAGVGFARKTGMDYALMQFESNNFNGIILNLDADCIVSNNYLESVYNALITKDDVFGTVYFEHQNPGSLNGKTAIDKYELYLRYYEFGLRYANYPFDMHTVGSCIAIKSLSYARFGGMNKKKAGEDFYFVHKLAPNIMHVFINDAVVYPSARKSDRVPFGTGASMNRMIDAEEEYQTYDPIVFEKLKTVCSMLSSDSLFNSATISFGTELDPFFDQMNFKSELERIRSNTSNPKSFKKQIFQWFNGFRVLKFIHFLTGAFYPKIDISTAASKHIKKMGIDIDTDVNKLLVAYRKLDRSYKGFGKIIA